MLFYPKVCDLAVVIIKSGLEIRFSLGQFWSNFVQRFAFLWGNFSQTLSISSDYIPSIEIKKASSADIKLRDNYKPYYQIEIVFYWNPTMAAFGLC